VGGPRYLLLAAVIYAPGIVLFVIAKREKKEAIFENAGERILCALLSAAAAVAVVKIATA
jgi:arginine:ornithine antiporter/lysine permease